MGYIILSEFIRVYLRSCVNYSNFIVIFINCAFCLFVYLFLCIQDDFMYINDCMWLYTSVVLLVTPGREACYRLCEGYVLTQTCTYIWNVNCMSKKKQQTCPLTMGSELETDLIYFYTEFSSMHVLKCQGWSFWKYLSTKVFDSQVNNQATFSPKNVTWFKLWLGTLESIISAIA